MPDTVSYPVSGDGGVLNRLFYVVRIIVLWGCVLISNAAAGENRLIMATTTSTDNTGLLEYLEPYFEKNTGIELLWTAVGTGKALEFGRNCDVDVLMVHAPEAEKQYVRDGYAVSRREIMFNDFVVIGPPYDPAGIKGKRASEAFAAVKEKEAVFVSRGDNSGTNIKEISLWEASGLNVPDRERWYVQTGQGMLSTIMITGERKGYTLTDRGTYIKYEDNMDGKPFLEILVEGDEILLNQYSVMAVNPKKCPDARYEKAMIFCDWMAGEQAQELIKNYRLLGKPLFTPNAR